MIKESNALTKTQRRDLGLSMQYEPRVRQPGEAMPPADNMFERGTYRTGDGDTGTYVPRPGSLVAFTLPSRGLR